LMQIMFEKRLVARNESQRAHIYSARVKEDVTKRRILRDLVDGVFGGATEQLVLQALNARRVTPEEIESIRRMLDDYEMDQQSRSEHDR
ncbi:MAG: BlaI/MecI/CopY family transcriptional regulator, partial [Planctomycetaceae bacterium]|nr:BlaI/MecI/CopY family transcriptional regulator [Planctomycetaceae bacterium]